MVYGPEYIIPSPFDKRLMEWVSYAVAETAIADGVAGVKNFDMKAYKERLKKNG